MNTLVNTETIEFNSSNSNFSELFEYNQLFLKNVEAFLNHRLNARGHVLVNDVLDAMDMPRTRNGCVMGWLKGSKLEFHIQQEDGFLLIDLHHDGDIHERI